MKSKYFSVNDHIQNLVSNTYYKNLVLLRNLIETGCDQYFSSYKAPKVDLYLISCSVTSPIGLGSDSKPIKFKLGNKNYCLADSSQFGMEPLVINFFDMVYCYLPSFRGENPDDRHLNQFYHCEAELRGEYTKAIEIAENLVKFLLNIIINSSNNKEIYFKELTSLNKLTYIAKNDFPKITFDKAVSLLEKSGYKNTIKYKKFGRVLTSEAESMITSLVGKNKLPVWVTNYDRDTVAFYQQPDDKDENKVLNADLLVPPLSDESFSGEILGLGQRQNNINKIIESMKRQNISNKGEYDWYIQLRKNKKYKITSGFGLGIERFIAWTLGLRSIADTSLYPVLKNSKKGY